MSSFLTLYVRVFSRKKRCINGYPVSISGLDLADRLQIRELVDAYAHCADRRDAKGQMSLFTKDTHFVVFMDARSEKPSMELNRREDLAPVFDELNKYELKHISWGKAL